MAVGTTALLVSGLLLGGGVMIDDREQQVAYEGAEDIGSAVMTELVLLDQQQTAGSGTTSVLSRNPDGIGSFHYRVELTDPSGSLPAVVVTVSGAEGDVEYITRFDPRHDICEAAVDGDDFFVTFDDSLATPCLTLEGEP
jgi:hypothetical protein